MPLKRMLITSNYGNRFHPVDRVNKFHAGIDLRANSDYVYAVLDGIVSEADYSGGAGNYIKVRHKDFETVYMHLTRSFYSEGDLIYAGDIIALSGNTGKSTAPHLHFAVKENGRYINPIQFLNDLIQNQLDQNKFLTFLKSNHSKALDHIDKYNIICMNYNLEMDLLCSNQAVVKMSARLNLNSVQSNRRFLLVERKKAIKKARKTIRSGR